MSAVSDLASRLYDSGQQFWGPSELVAYLTEALRTWNAMTSFWRKEMIFPTVAGDWWYDIPSQVNSIRPYTVLDNDLITQIEFHLLEPTTSNYPLTWTGSSQFSLDDILGAIQRRRDETLSTTGCTITRSLVGAAQFVRTTLPDTVIDIRRVAWLPQTMFTNVALRSSDDFAEESFDYGYTTTSQAPPSTYRQTAQPPLSFDVDTVPPVAGQYEILSVSAGGLLNVTNPSLMGIPDDWTWVVKWGALSDLLNRDSLSRDPYRAGYCKQRYQEGLGLLFDAAAILALRIQNLPVAIDAVRNGDDFDANWQSVANGPPLQAYSAGLNLIGLSPAPSAGPFSVTASVVENAPVPVAPSDMIQLSRDDYDAVLDYAQHLASFKEGGAEFLSTIPLYQGFLKRASLYNSKLSQLGQFQKPMYEMAQLEQERNPVYSTETPRGG